MSILQSFELKQNKTMAEGVINKVSRTLFHGEDVRPWRDHGEFATASATGQADLVGKSETHLAAWRSATVWRSLVANRRAGR